MAGETSPNVPVFRLPWPAAAAALVAFAALSVTGKGYGVLPALGAVILSSYLVPWRLADGSWGAWMIRLIAFGAVVAANVADPSKDRGHGFYDPAYIHAFGQLCAAELSIQCWRERPSGGPGGAMALLLSGLVFLTACNTFDTRYIRWFAPPYLFFIALAARAAAVRVRVPERRLARMAGAWIGSAMLALALGIGFGISHGIYAYRIQLYRLVRDLDDSIRGPRKAIGFSDRPILGERVSLAKSFVRVLRLEGAPPGAHLRGMAFDTYEAGRWSPLVEGRQLATTRVSELHPEAEGPRCRVTRLIDGYPYLFAPLHAKGLAPERVQEVEQDETLIRVSAPAPYSYEIVLSRFEGEQGPLCVPPNESSRARCLALAKSLDARVRVLAEKIVEGVNDPAERVHAVERYLRGTHAYSLEAVQAKGDPVSDFLLHEGRTGHCEYFASAAAILLRCAGVPSRYVVGFYVHENAGDGAAVVRQQDAHAWAEAWIDGKGWMTVEATPPEGLPDRIAAPVPFWRRAWEWVNDSALGLGDWLAELSFMQLGMLSAGLAAAVISLLWLRELLARRKKRKSNRPPYENTDGVLSPLAARFEALLARVGTPCPPQQTWLEHLRELAHVPAASTAHAQPLLKLDSAKALAFVNEYNRARFGHVTNPAAGELEGMLRALETPAETA
ncbi:MAG: transglutaminase domain-containing protein [Planctomycetes bacterium]|nr:transglutaminase domain-containing protein [Planctomycetota bacterium]